MEAVESEKNDNGNEERLVVNEFPRLSESVGKDRGNSDVQPTASTTVSPLTQHQGNNKDVSSSHVNGKNTNGNVLMKSFAETVKPDACVVNNKLSLIPTEIKERREVVVFDDELLMEGSKKWMLTLCGHFVGC